MDKLSEVLHQRAQPVATSNDSPNLLTPLQDSCSRVAFIRSLTALVALKRTASLTQPQIEAWYAVLGHFPEKWINAAVIEMCLTETRFPEVGDLYTICRRRLPKEYSPMGDGHETERPSRTEVRAVAKRLGLDV